MANSRKKCKFCKEWFFAADMIKTNSGNFCTYKHAADWAQENIMKGRIRKLKGEPAPRTKKLAAHTDKVTYAKIETTRKEVNKAVRLRDAGKPCISCNTPWSDSFDAGHFIGVGSVWRQSWLRFHPWNINGQCVGCNRHKSGNESKYSFGIIERFGVERLEQLKELERLAHRSPPLTAQDLIDIRRGAYKFLLIDQDSN